MLVLVGPWKKYVAAPSNSETYALISCQSLPLLFCTFASESDADGRFAWSEVELQAVCCGSNGDKAGKRTHFVNKGFCVLVQEEV